MKIIFLTLKIIQTMKWNFLMLLSGFVAVFSALLTIAFISVDPIGLPITMLILFLVVFFAIFKRLGKETRIGVCACAIVYFIVQFATFGAEQFLQDRIALAMRYKNFSITNEPLIDLGKNLADENGMNYLGQSYVWHDTVHHVNKQGFLAKFDYTRENTDSFKKQGKKVVFVLGDSFTEGVAPGGYEKTLIEILRKNPNHAIYSFGIGGMDPLQYWLVTKKFLTELQPDLVVINFCFNDVMNAGRKPTPHIPLYWTTNVGQIASITPGEFLASTQGKIKTYHTMYEAYNEYASYSDIRKDGRVGWLCGQLRLTTYAYREIWPIFADSSTKKFYQQCDVTYNYRYVRQIDSACKANNIPLEIAFIPDPHKVHQIKTLADNIREYEKIFKDLLPKTHFLTGLSRSDYISMDDEHFNDAGNAKFARFLENSVISKKLVTENR